MISRILAKYSEIQLQREEWHLEDENIRQLYEEEYETREERLESRK